MYTGSPINLQGRNGVVCAYLDDKARVQFVGAAHGPQWVAVSELTEGWSPDPEAARASERKGYDRAQRDLAAPYGSAADLLEEWLTDDTWGQHS